MKIRFLMLQFFLAIAFSIGTNAQNLIVNPGFEDALSGWSTNMNNGSSAQYTTDTTNSPEGIKHFKGIVSKLGTNDWDLQLRSSAFAVDESHQYRLTFKAKSETSGKNLGVYIQKDAWMGTSFTLTDTWETYSYEFFPNEAVKQLKFNFVETTNYYIDDILLEDISTVNGDYNTPPSCVITNPHVNAYYKKGSAVTINAYAADIGGSGPDGEIALVEFFVDGQKIGESATSENYTFSQIWDAGVEGEFRITTKATDNEGKSFTSAGVWVTIGNEDYDAKGLSASKGKYIANIIDNSGVELKYLDYWNGVTSENGGKWQTVERNRNSMNWSNGDKAYNYAKNNHLLYRYHTLAWGSQYPSWITTLTPSQFQAEMEQFIKAVADRYPYIDQIDVLNEPLPGHQEGTKYFIDGLGGAGESGYDWAVWLFKKAREYFPNSKLILNDYSIINSTSNIRGQQLLLKVLRDSALVDGFGAQAHTFSIDNMQAGNLKENLDLMATSGIPVFLTELDMQGVNTDEDSQLSNYQNLFPVLWEHPAVAGITLWGYVYGNMWRPDAGLIYSDGTERSCMVWLRDYMNQQEDLGYPSAGTTVTSSDVDILNSKESIRVYPNPSNGNISLQNNSGEKQNVTIYDVYGRKVEELVLNALSKSKSYLPSGLYLVKTNNNQVIKLVIKNE